MNFKNHTSQICGKKFSLAKKKNSW